MLNVLTCFPGIGLKKAKEISKRFKSLKEFFEAPYVVLESFKISKETYKKIRRVYLGDF